MAARRLRLGVSLLALLAVACGGGRRADPPGERQAKPGPATSPDASTPPASADAAAHDAAHDAALAPLVPAAAPAPVAILQGGQVFTVVPGEPPRPTGVTPDESCADTLGIGSGAPLLSPDGRWLAYVFKGDVHAVELARPEAPTRLTRLARVADMCAQIGGWSPDGRRLLFYVAEADTMDGPATPLPPGTPRGFFLWEREGGQPPQALPALQGFTAWMPAGDAVLEVRAPEAGRPLQLLRIALPDGAETVLHTLDDPYGFGQLVAGRTTVVFGTRTGLQVAPLANVAGARSLVEGGFARDQFPKLSPDERYVVYEHETAPDAPRLLEARPLAGDGPVVSLGALTSEREYEWYDGAHLLVRTSRGILLRSLSGAETPVAAEGASLVRRTP